MHNYVEAKKLPKYLTKQQALQNPPQGYFPLIDVCDLLDLDFEKLQQMRQKPEHNHGKNWGIRHTFRITYVKLSLFVKTCPLLHAQN